MKLVVSALFIAYYIRGELNVLYIKTTLKHRFRKHRIKLEKAKEWRYLRKI